MSRKRCNSAPFLPSFKSDESKIDTVITVRESMIESSKNIEEKAINSQKTNSQAQCKPKSLVDKLKERENVNCGKHLVESLLSPRVTRQNVLISNTLKEQCGTDSELTLKESQFNSAKSQSDRNGANVNNENKMIKITEITEMDNEKIMFVQSVSSNCLNFRKDSLVNFEKYSSLLKLKENSCNHFDQQKSKTSIKNEDSKDKSENSAQMHQVEAEKTQLPIFVQKRDEMNGLTTADETNAKTKNNCGNQVFLEIICNSQEEQIGEADERDQVDAENSEHMKRKSIVFNYNIKSTNEEKGGSVQGNATEPRKVTIRIIGRTRSVNRSIDFEQPKEQQRKSGEDQNDPTKNQAIYANVKTGEERKDVWQKILDNSPEANPPSLNAHDFNQVNQINSEARPLRGRLNEIKQQSLDSSFRSISTPPNMSRQMPTALQTHKEKKRCSVTFRDQLYPQEEEEEEEEEQEEQEFENGEAETYQEGIQEAESRDNNELFDYKSFSFYNPSFKESDIKKDVELASNESSIWKRPFRQPPLPAVSTDTFRPLNPVKEATRPPVKMSLFDCGLFKSAKANKIKGTLLSEQKLIGNKLNWSRIGHNQPSIDQMNSSNYKVLIKNKNQSDGDESSKRNFRTNKLNLTRLRNSSEPPKVNSYFNNFYLNENEEYLKKFCSNKSKPNNSVNNGSLINSKQTMNNIKMPHLPIRSSSISKATLETFEDEEERDEMKNLLDEMKYIDEESYSSLISKEECFDQYLTDTTKELEEFDLSKPNREDKASKSVFYNNNSSSSSNSQMDLKKMKENKTNNQLRELKKFNLNANKNNNSLMKSEQFLSPILLNDNLDFKSDTFDFKNQLFKIKKNRAHQEEQSTMLTKVRNANFSNDFNN